MNRKFFASTLSLFLLGGMAAFGDDKPMEKTDEKKVTTASGTAKSKDYVIVGTVKEYEAGKELKVLVGKKMHSFTLGSKSVKASVAPTVAVGAKVKVVESRDASGIKTLTVNIAS